MMRKDPTLSYRRFRLAYLYLLKGSVMTVDDLMRRRRSRLDGSGRGADQDTRPKGGRS
jgi:hypothetical protein